MKNIFYYHTNIGLIGIAEEDNQITNLFFESDICHDQNLSTCSKDSEYAEKKGYYHQETDLLQEASRQLYEYLEGKRKTFILPLAPSGTDFMKNIWKCLCDIPYGKTKSYKAIAQAVGNVKACRAVGHANNRNPIPIFIPCHRVIGENGKLIGYRGGLETKLQLLELEKTILSEE